ncbi:MAG: OmpH family outer membrane protein [Candidatus Gastranaerophilales bacterium]|nr:OmpH family outer membrane protein [Candidatus Gastranaerophilales bacterium]
MKRFIAVLMITLSIMISNSAVFASGLGYVDYEKVIENCSFALNAKKKLDSKAIEIKQYMFDKEKEYEAIQSPVQKQNFQDKVTAEMKSKQAEYMRMQAKTEQEVFTKIREVATKIMVEQKLDAIISDKAVFCGGVDITNTLIDRLKGVK